MAALSESATYGWAGPLRLTSRAGLALLGVAVVAWSGLALGVGRGTMVDEVGVNDYGAYFGASSSGRRGLFEPLAHALTISLPWSALLPIPPAPALPGVERGRRAASR